jgi:acetyl esterase/lipase
MTYMKSILLLLAIPIIVGFSSCKKTEAADSEVKQQDILNVSYGAEAAQKLDVYLPANRNSDKTKVLVFIHGGSWSGGDKAEFNSAISALRIMLPDYAIFNLNYRLATTASTRFPAQIDDVQSAINFISSKSGEYKINANKIGLIGASAGAQLALLQAYKNNSNGKIKAVVDLFGPADLTALYNNHPFPTASQPTLVGYLGTTPGANATLYQQASPITFVNSTSVATQIFHGELDYVVPIAQSTALKAKLQSFNVKVEMVTYAGEGHGWFGSNLFDTYSKVVTFIQQNVQ